MASEQFQVNLDALRTMVVVITDDNSWTVRRNDALKTSLCDFDNKTIWLTIRNIPKGLPAWKSERLMDGVCAHEAGHPIITGPYIEAYSAWIKTKYYPNLADYVQNVYEDQRVNFYMRNRYRFDFGPRMKEVHDMNAKSMAEYCKRVPLETHRLEKATISLTLLTLKNIDLTDYLDSEAADAVTQAAAILKAAKHKRITKDIVTAVNKATNIMERLIKRPKQSEEPKKDGEGGDGEGGGGEAGESTGEEEKPRAQWDGGEQSNYDRDVEPQYIPDVMGGEARLDATRDEIEAAQEEYRKMQEAARKLAEEAAKQVQNGVASGLTTGVEEPHPEANWNLYRQLVQKNTYYIAGLLNRLKSLQNVRWSTDRFTRRGRYMVELHPLFKALSMGKGKPFDRRFEGSTITYDKVETKIALLVDMSISMNETEARDALTIIAETSGRWLPSQDFSIAVFGTNHQVVKAFIEPYHTTRARIGGVSRMGSTNLARPLQVLIKMLSSYRKTAYELVLVIVSDFDPTDDEEESKQAIKEAEKLGIKVVGVGLCNSDLATVREYTTRATYVEHLNQLPALFFRLYRATVSGKLR